MRKVITARWVGVSLKNPTTWSSKTCDIVEIDYTFYVLIHPDISNHDIELYHYLYLPSQSELDEYTVQRLELVDYYGIYYIVLERDPDWVLSETRCECGGDATYGINNTAHSFWCPKYKKEK